MADTSNTAEIRIDRVILREVRLPFVDFFETSFGRVEDKEAILVEVEGGDKSGWGECVAAEGPFYSYEDRHTAWHILTQYLLPFLFQHSTLRPEDFVGLVSRVRGHPMAKASVEAALWDLEAKLLEQPLWRSLGGSRRQIPCGVSIGIQENRETLFEKISRELDAGYKRIKIKIKPGWDLDVVQAVRDRFGDIPLMVDANAAYTLDNKGHLKCLDSFDLMMIEQPLGYDDLVEHAVLQGSLSTPICLDESIRHLADVRHGLDLGSCRIINMKLGRVGGYSEARKIHDYCRTQGTPVWCGGMLETGIGRAHNIALSTLENFSLPGDVSASSRYFARDVIVPPVQVIDGLISVPEGAGIGFQPDLGWIEKITVRREVISREDTRTEVR